METRANYIAIGIFTLAVFAMAIGFIYWLVRYGETTDAREVQLIIPSDAGGLKLGSGVLFNGLRVGAVTSVKLSQADPANVYATMKVKLGTPLRADTQVTVSSQPLTGLANVSLVGGTPDSPLILEQEETPVLRAQASALNDILAAASKTITVANGVLAKVDGLLDDNIPNINKTVANVEKVTSVVADKTDEIDELLVNVGKASTALASLSDTLGVVSKDVGAIVEAVDPDTVKSTLNNAEKITGDLARNTEKFDGILDDAKTAVSGASTLVTSLTATAQAINGDQLARTLSSVEGISTDLQAKIKLIDGEKISNTLSSFETFATKLEASGKEIDVIIADAKTATSDVTKVTGTLAENRENLDSIIKDATVVASRLVKTSEAITKLVGTVDGLVEADGRGFVVEATDAATSIRKVAESFEKRADAISGGLARFSTRGLSDIEALIGQSRTAVSRLENIIKNIENNPAQFLLRGEQVPEYRRQRR